MNCWIAPRMAAVTPPTASAHTAWPDRPIRLAENEAGAGGSIGMVARIPTLLVVPATSEARTIADLLQRGRAEPGNVAFASAGHGSAAHLSAELFPKGGAPALTDLADGPVDFGFSAFTSSDPFF